MMGAGGTERMARDREKIKRGIYLLPTTFTVANLVAGFAAIIAISAGKVEFAALAIVAACIFDGLDGRVARWTNTTSEFGAQFDSLADVVSFGVAPALLVLEWGLGSLGRIGWVIAGLYVVCAAMRLARFNIGSRRPDPRYTVGLPSPPPAALLATGVLLLPQPKLDPAIAGVAIVTASLGLLMISHLRYRTFKDVDLRERRPFFYVLVLASIVMVLTVEPRWMLFVISAVYAVSGPLIAVRRALLPMRRDEAWQGAADGRR